MLTTVPANTTATIYLDKPTEVSGGIHTFIL